MNQRYDVLGFGLLMLAFALAGWTGIVGPINEPGSKGFIFEYQTLIGSGIAVLAAIVALRPAYQQLAELRIQTRQRELEMLSARSVQLNEDRLAMFATWADAEVFRDELTDTATQLNISLFNDGPRERLDAALEQLKSSINKLHSRRGNHWGDASVHRARNECIDTALRVGSIAISANRRPSIALLHKLEDLRLHGLDLAAILDVAATNEMARIAEQIGKLEERS